MMGHLNIDTHGINSVDAPEETQDAATKAYVSCMQFKRVMHILPVKQDLNHMAKLKNANAIVLEVWVEHEFNKWILSSDPLLCFN